MARGRAVHAERPRTGHDFIETHDVDGNLVRIPAPKSVDKRQPIEDDQGRVNEFVNITGRVQQHCMGYPQENDTIKVPVAGIVKGEQFRDFSEPAPAWGKHPPYVERIRVKDGEYDPVYLLTAEQVLAEVLAISSWEWGPEKLELLRDHGKIQEMDDVGKPKHPPEDLYEDRSKVNSAIGRKLAELKVIAKKNMDILTGKLK